MPGVAITSTLPTVGSTVGPTWASELITWCDEIEADLEAAIVPSEITVNQDFAFGGYKITGMGGARFTPNVDGASSGASNASMLEVAGNDLYFVDANGTSIQITSGGSVNVLSTGGIGGDYPSSAASVTYSNSTDLYTFSDDSTPAKPAKMNCGQIQLRYESASSNAVTIKAPSGVATYNIIMPTDKGTGNQVIAGTTAGSDLTLAPTSTLTGQMNFTGGITVKNSAPGNSVLAHYEDQGTAWTTTTTTTDLGWTPVLYLNNSTADINYLQRIAFVQKVGPWVTVMANIRFYQDSGGEVTGAIRIEGLPYAAHAGGGGGAAGTLSGMTDPEDYIVGMGTCAAFPYNGGTDAQYWPVTPVVFGGHTTVQFVLGVMSTTKVTGDAGAGPMVGTSEFRTHVVPPGGAFNVIIPDSATSGADFPTQVVFQMTYKATA